MDYYQQQLTRSTLNFSQQLNQTEDNFCLSQMFSEIEQPQQTFPNNYKQLVCMHPSSSNKIFFLQNLIKKTFMAHILKQQKEEKVQREIPMLNTIRRKYIQLFQWYQAVGYFSTQILLNELLKTHKSIQSNHYEYTKQKIETQEDHNNQLLNLKNEFIIHNVRNYYERLQQIWGQWKKYYLFYFNTTRIYAKNTQLIECLIGQQWNNFLKKQNFLQYYGKKKMLENCQKKFSIKKQYQQIKSFLSKFNINKQILIHAQNNLKKELEFSIQKLSHKQFIQKIQKVINIYDNVKQYVMKYVESYNNKSKYLLDELKTLFQRCQRYYLDFNKDIESMKLNQQQITEYAYKPLLSLNLRKQQQYLQLSSCYNVSFLTHYNQFRSATTVSISYSIMIKHINFM